MWDRHVVRSAEGEPDLLYIDLHLVHEVTSPQAFDGLRIAGRRVRRPDLTVATMDHNVPTAGLDQPARGPDLGHPDPGARAELQGVRDPLLRDGRSRPGHRARDRTRAGADAAGHDDRVRRQPHLDARRVRRARVRHRHERGRARARHADAAADEAGHDGDHRRRRSSPRRHREGRRARDHRRHRHRRRHRLGARVPRRRDPRVVDGRAHDGVQHVDRGRRARRARRDPTTRRSPTSRVARRAPKGKAWEQALDDWRSLVTDDDAAFDKIVDIDAATLLPQVSWGTNPSQTVTIDDTVPDPERVRRRRLAGIGEACARVHGLEGEHTDARHRGRHGVHRVVHQLADRRPARGGRGRRRAGT